MRNKKGLTLVELIGAIVILGILMTLLASIFGIFINSQRRVSISAKANTEGLLVIRIVKNDLIEFSPNTFQDCLGDNCIMLEKEYEYIYDEDNEIIDLKVYNDPLSYKIEVKNNSLYLNDEIYDFNGFTLTDDSGLTYEEIDGVLYLTIVLYLVDTENNIFEYIISDSVVLSEIPS